MFQSLTREQPLCYLAATTKAATMTLFQSLTREQPLCYRLSYRMYQGHEDRFQSLHREQPLCYPYIHAEPGTRGEVSIAHSRTAPLLPFSSVVRSFSSSCFNRSLANSPSATCTLSVSKMGLCGFNRSLANSPSATKSSCETIPILWSSFNRSLVNSPSATSSGTNCVRTISLFQSLTRG